MGVVFLLVWFVLAIVVAVMAGSRGRSSLGWFLLAVLISPLIAALFLLLAGDSQAKVAAGQPGPNTHVRCVACKEWVLPEATKCKHCGTALEPTSIAPPQKLQIRGMRGSDTALAVLWIVIALFVVAAVVNNLMG